MNTALGLELFDALPDLRLLAREQEPHRLYVRQDELREEFRRQEKAFRWSMPLRHLRTCGLCREKFTQALYQLENPKNNTRADCDSMQLHLSRQHNEPLNADVRRFLEEVQEDLERGL